MSIDEPLRPANQQHWTGADVRALTRDREHMQAVRDLNMISNPEEFSNIFAGEGEDGEERVTPGNLLAGNRDAEFYGERYVDPEIRNGPVEIVEMHQSMNYHDEEWTDQRNADPRDLSFVPGFFNDDESDDGNGPRLQWDEAQYDTIADAAFAEINQRYWVLPEHQRDLFLQDVTQTMIRLVEDHNQPQWRRSLASDLTYSLLDAGHAREQAEEERARERRHQRRLDQAEDEQRDIERRLNEGAKALRQLRRDYQATSERFATEEEEMWNAFSRFKDAADRSTISLCRRHDIYTWFPWLPHGFRSCLAHLSDWFRRETSLKFGLNYLRAFQDDRAFRPDPLDEEDWAAIAPPNGRAFGYEDQNTQGGFAWFISPNMARPVNEILARVQDEHFLRVCRIEAAGRRMAGGRISRCPSDEKVVGQYLTWQGHACHYLMEMSELQEEEVDTREELAAARDAQRRILALMGTMIEMEKKVRRDWDMVTE